MALALLVFSEPNDETGSARMLLRQVTKDNATLVRYRNAFDSDLSRNANEFDNVKKQLVTVQRHLQDLSMRYHRYPRQAFKRVLQDEGLKRLWPDLCTRVDRLSKHLDKVTKSNYSRFDVWRKLDDIKIAYEDILEELESIADREDRMRGMRRG